MSRINALPINSRRELFYKIFLTKMFQTSDHELVLQMKVGMCVILLKSLRLESFDIYHTNISTQLVFDVLTLNVSMRMAQWRNVDTPELCKDSTYGTKKY